MAYSTTPRTRDILSRNDIESLSTPDGNCVDVNKSCSFVAVRAQVAVGVAVGWVGVIGAFECAQTIDEI